MKQIQHVRVWALALAVAGLARPIAAQTPPPATPAPAQPAGQGIQVDTYVVGQAKPPVEPGASLHDLTLEEAIQIALENNLDLKVARMTPQLQDYALRSLDASFKPVIMASLNQNPQSIPNTDALLVVDSNITNAQTYSTNYSQGLRFWGASYSAQFTSGRSSNNLPTQLRNPNLSASTRLQYNQPLLANFK